MRDQRACLFSGALFLGVGCLIPCAAAADEGGFSLVNTITRLQVRHSVDENSIVSFTASSFMQARNKTYVLGVLDYQKDKARDTTSGRLEGNFGGPILDSPVGWVARGRSYYKGDSAIALGAQFNFNDVPAWKPVLRKYGVTTFVQIFRNVNEPYFGDFEFLHYYSIDMIPGKLALRGYNIFNKGGGRGFVRNSWADLIYSANRRWDIYYRAVNVSHENQYLGKAGTTNYLGMRLNFY